MAAITAFVLVESLFPPAGGLHASADCDDGLWPLSPEPIAEADASQPGQVVGFEAEEVLATVSKCSCVRCNCWRHRWDVAEGALERVLSKIAVDPAA